MQYYTDSSNNRTNYRYDLNQMIPAAEGPSSATRVLNASYLVNYHDHSNGVGAQIVYHTAFNNSNGTPYTSDGDNRYDPFFCVWHSSDCSGNAYAPMNNKMWTEQVVYQITTTGKDSSATSLAPATTTYHYLLTKTTGACTADTAWSQANITISPRK